MELWRSLLYVPAHETERVKKAVLSEADCVILDLEDSVPESQKEKARDQAVDVICSLADYRQRPVIIRINGAKTRWHDEDIFEIRNCTPNINFGGIRIPKVESAQYVREIASELGPGAALQLLIETARGITRMNTLATAHPSVTSIGLGETDLSSDLSWNSDTALDQVRLKLVIEAKSAGLMRPSASVFTNVKDISGLANSTLRLKNMGFFGRNVIHPLQVSIVNSIFTPTSHELETAQNLLNEASEQCAAGVSAFIRADGTFVDPAVMHSAEQIVALNNQIASQSNVSGR